MKRVIPFDGKPWPIRAVQLDLARQRESITTIRRFIAFAAEWGFNTLHLYLEGVVRTSYFPYRQAEASYHPDDIRTIVGVADAHGMTVVPCVNTLSHAEHFIGCSELAHLAETGRSHPGGYMLCPSLPETFTFLESYLGELADLFPGNHFNLGGDEAWRLGGCPRCRQRLKDGEAWADLFITHIQQVTELLRRLGKTRPWMWDDMLEFCNEAQIDRLPRDLILCAWHYDADVLTPSGIRGHFNRRHRRNWLAIYDRLGFDVLIAPSACSGANLLAFNHHARQVHHPCVVGGVQTVWELTDRFLASQMPQVALAGQTWTNPNQPPDEAVDLVIDTISPAASSPAQTALRRLIAGRTCPTLSSGTLASLYQGPTTLAENQAELAAIMDDQLIADLTPGAGLWAEHILADLQAQAHATAIFGRLRRLLPWAIDPRSTESDRTAIAETLTWCKAELTQLGELHATQWSQRRPGITPDTASPRYHRLAAELTPIIERLHQPPSSDQAVVELNLFLYEAYSAPILTISLRAAGRWREVCSGTFKPLNLCGGFYTMQVPIDLSAHSFDAIRFVVVGYGGQGIGYVMVHQWNQSWAPSTLMETSGPVTTPEAILRDDASCCYLGCPDTVDTLMNFHENEPATIQIALEPNLENR